MFVFESCVFLLFLGSCCAWDLIRTEIEERRDRHAKEELKRIVLSLQGQCVRDMESQFGPVWERVEGHYGRDLLIWKSSFARGFPKSSSIFIVSATADHEGHVLEAAWRKQ